MARASTDLAMRLLSLSFLLLAAACGGPDNSAPLTGAALGEKAFAQDCSLCHIAAPPDSAAAKLPRPGPNLYGVYGRRSAQGDFAYSKAMRNAGLVWDEPTLHTFIENPKKFMPQTQMSFAGERDPVKRQAIIDYLKTLK